MLRWLPGRHIYRYSRPGQTPGPNGVNADENMTQVRRSGIDPPPSITCTIAGWELIHRRDRVAFQQE